MPPRVYVDPSHAGHRNGPGHPECPDRVDACLAALDAPGGTAPAVDRREAPSCARALLERVHPARYLDRLEAHCARGWAQLDPDTACGSESFAVASRAAGACAEAAAAALDEGIRSFCLVRPPGHHATPTRPMGFCLLNAVAVGAASVLERAGRVAIVDIDVHHGNGTQEVFWRDPRVLYVSLHQWPWYPFYAGGLDEVGEAEGEGTNVNIPLPAGSGDDTYLASLDRIVLPVVRAFAPRLLLVSAGFDAHLADPLSQTAVTTAGYGQIAARLVAVAEEVCGGAVAMTLEGGYDLDALAASFVATLGVLAGGDAPPLEDATAKPGPWRDASAGAAELERAVAFHARRWPAG